MERPFLHFTKVYNMANAEKNENVQHSDSDVYPDAKSQDVTDPRYRMTLSPNEKRDSLLDAASKPQVGRREPSEPVYMRERNRSMIRGTLLGLVVVIAVVVILMVVASFTGAE